MGIGAGYTFTAGEEILAKKLNLCFSGATSASGMTITGSTIDSSTIGATSASTGVFTTINTSGNITLTKAAGSFSIISSSGRSTIIHRSSGTTGSNTDTPVFQFNRATNALPSGSVVGEMRFDGLNTGSGYALYGEILVTATGAATGTGSPSRMDFVVSDGTTTPTILQIASTGATVTGDLTTSSTAFLHKTSAALANGAAAQAGTLLNGPAAGNPTKWIPISDNGTTRYIPAW